MIVTYIVAASIFTIIAIVINRQSRLRHDQILNPEHEPYLAFAEQERLQKKALFSPWTTSDKNLLAIALQYFPHIPIPLASDLAKPDISPVKIDLLDEDTIELNDTKSYFVAVGGPPAAMLAFQQAQAGNPVLYVNDMSSTNRRPIWAGAANHGEPDVLTEAPAYFYGRSPVAFLYNEFLRFLNPGRYDSQVLRDDFPWLTLNISDWARHPAQWLAGLRVFWGNLQLARRHAKSKDDADDLFHELKKRAHNSGDYLEVFNQRNARILRTPRGSLIIAPDKETWEALLRNVELLKDEGRALMPVTAAEAEQKYGFTPRDAAGLMEKTHDFIFEPTFLATIMEQIKNHDGEIRTAWRLRRILVDPAKDRGGVLEFIETKADGNRITHYRKFSHAHLSLGSTLFTPRQYDLVSVTGVSINALVFGAKLDGGPFICGGTGNHIAVTPLAAHQDISFIRIAAGGCVGPLNREDRWYTYYGRTAINALHCLKKTLPAAVAVKVLSVTGCNRVLGKDGRQIELHPVINIMGRKTTVNSVTLQLGAGGGGLTQMGALAPASVIPE